MTSAEDDYPLAGDKLYHERARAALPLLVRQALATVPITYFDLATELGMQNPRNLNYVLGCIGESLRQLSEDTGQDIPPLQCLVFNKATGVPGEGVGWFLNIEEGDFALLSAPQKRRVIEAEQQRIYAFPDWLGVLSTLDLEPARPAPSTESLVAGAATFCGAGESDYHLALKRHVAQTPSLLALPDSATANVEYSLPSGDSVDVMFISGDRWIAVEVKSRISADADLLRGLFQCVKYRAVCRAHQSVLGMEPDARAVLVIEGLLPTALRPLKNTLGVEVIENVRTSAS